jgi:hypothetical protein
MKEYIDSINHLNWIVCDGILSEISKLENMNADEYYSTVNTFLWTAKQKNKEK